MGIGWDWLEPLITAPYVPALGPTHPAAVTPGLFGDVIEIAGTGRFLPHDKDRRWTDRKDEQVLTGDITQEPGLVLIPTLSTGRRCVKVHVYGQHPRSALSRAAELGRRLCEDYAAGKGRLIWFLPPGSDPDPVTACTRIQMRTFGPGHHAPPPSPVLSTGRGHRARPRDLQRIRREAGRRGLRLPRCPHPRAGRYRPGAHLPAG